MFILLVNIIGILAREFSIKDHQYLFLFLQRNCTAVSGLGVVGKALGSAGQGGGDVDSTETDTDITTETSTGDSSSDDLGEPTCENSITAQANAKPGDILQRADGTKVELTQGDVNWAKQLIKDVDSGEADTGDVEIDSQDIGEAQVEDDEDTEESSEDSEEGDDGNDEATDEDEEDSEEEPEVLETKKEAEEAMNFYTDDSDVPS